MNEISYETLMEWQAQIQVGDLLHASCSQRIYGVISKLNEDGSVDIKNVRVADIVDCNIIELDRVGQETTGLVREVKIENFSTDEKYVTLLEERSGEVPNLSKEPFMKENMISGYVVAWIVLDTPGDGCGRCTKRFTVLRGK